MRTSPQPLASATCRRACMHTATQRYMISSYCSMRNDGNLAICCYVPFVLAGSTVCGGSVCQSPQQCAGEQGVVLCFWSPVKSANHGAATSHNSTTYYLLQPRWCWSGCSSRRIYKHVPVIHSECTRKSADVQERCWTKHSRAKLVLLRWRQQSTHACRWCDVL